MPRRLAVLLLAVAALGAAGCGGEDVTGRDGADRTNGKNLFVSGSEGKASCGSCHALADAGTVATVGPDLDEAFGYACRQGFDEETIFSVVHGQIDLASGAMPPDLVTGQDAVDVAAYVASVAGKDIEGCDPSGDVGGATTGGADTGATETTSD
ncbi:MAG TPA: c-type cytochrome [Gaiellaceae bacterium]|nr:c-type cytochrome [Gaiellaceae bacterium]